MTVARDITIRHADHDEVPSRHHVYADGQRIGSIQFDDGIRVDNGTACWQALAYTGRVLGRGLRRDDAGQLVVARGDDLVPTRPEPETYAPGEVYRSAITCDESITNYATGAEQPCGSQYRLDGECIAWQGHTAVIARRHARDYVERAVRELQSAEAAARRQLAALTASGHPAAAAAARARVDGIVETRSALELLNL